MANDIKLETVIANATEQGLTMKVGNPQCFVRLASVKKGEHYTVRLCLDWTYQEFVLEGKSDAAMKFLVSSDDCCDYERITMKELQPGVFVAETVARKQAFGGREEAEDAASQTPQSVSPLKKESLFRWRFWVKE